MWGVWGVRGYARVCAGVCGCVRVCAGVHEIFKKKKSKDSLSVSPASSDRRLEGPKRPWGPNNQGYILYTIDNFQDYGKTKDKVISYRAYKM